MPIITMPDGTPVSFPDDMPRDQIREIITSKFPEETGDFGAPEPIAPAPEISALGPIDDATPDIEEMPQQQPSFAERRERVRGTRQQIQRGELPSWTLPVQIAGQTAGVGAQAIESAVGGVLNLAGMLPTNLPPGQPQTVGEFVPQQVGAAAEAVGGLPLPFTEATVGETAMKGLQAISELEAPKRYAEWKKEQPAGGIVVDALGNIVRLGAEVLPAAQVAGIPLKGAVTAGRGAIAGAGEALSTARLGMSARDFETLSGALADMKDVSRSAYQRSEELGAVLNPLKSIEIWDKLDEVIPDPTSTASQNLYRSTLSAIDDFKTDVEAGQISLETLDRHRQVLGNIGKDITNPNRAQEAQKAIQAIKIIDESVDGFKKEDILNQSLEAVEALNKGREQWAKAKNFEKILDVVEKVSGDPTKGGRIDPIKLRNQFKTLSTNKKRMMGFTDVEKELIRNVAKQNTMTGIVGLFAKFGIDTKNIFTKGIGLTAMGAGFGLPGAATLAVIGTAAKAGQQVAGAGRVGKLLQEIESR